MSSHGQIRVLLGDDHRIVREGLKQVLADAPDIEVVAEAADRPRGAATRAALGGDEGLDVVLLDIALPDRDGLDVLQALQEAWPALPVLMLSTYPESQYAVRCIKLGAAGYLNKSADPDDMVAARAQGGGRRHVRVRRHGRGAGQRGRRPAAGAAAPRRCRTASTRCSACSPGRQAVSEIGAQLGWRPTRSAPTARASSKRPAPRTTWSSRCTPSSRNSHRCDDALVRRVRRPIPEGMRAGLGAARRSARGEGHPRKRPRATPVIAATQGCVMRRSTEMA